ncbi:MAG: glycosyltransferase family 2 protein [Abitibacteriaceae bacterium]|nr:glycosyltransferase family 2 protein [Abditibacteriaceae bacterium]
MQATTPPANSTSPATCSGPAVSVIIPVYNRSRYLTQAIDSALNQTLPPAEIIVVDDGSTDNTPDVMGSYGHRIRSVRQTNAGVSAARNTGLRMAEGDLIAFLDSDDIWLPQKLELQVKRFMAEPDIGAVHCGVMDIDAEGNPLNRHPDGLEGWLAKEMLLIRGPSILCPGSTGLISRAALEVAGEFDVGISAAEDWDFFYRIALRYKIGYVPEVLMYYRHHGANGHRNLSKFEYGSLLAFAKAFENAPPEIAKLRRQSFGNLHMNLAGSFFQAKQYGKFIRHLGLSLWLTPHNSRHVLSFFYRKCRAASKSAHTPPIRSTLS